MKAQLKRIDRAEVMRLISESECVKLSENDKKIFDRCLMLTSSLWVGLVEGKLICTWGLIPPTLMSDQAYLWLYTTPALKEHQFIFVRKSQIALEGMLKEYPLITGHASAENTQAIRWLKWLGATFSDPVGKFLPFTIRKK